MPTRDSPGLIGDITSIASNGLRAVRSRLELLTIELTEEKAWAMRFIVVVFAAVYLISFGTLLAILAVSLAMPEAARPAVLGGFGGFFLAAGIGGGGPGLAPPPPRHPPFLGNPSGLIGRCERHRRKRGGGACRA